MVERIGVWAFIIAATLTLGASCTEKALVSELTTGREAIDVAGFKLVLSADKTEYTVGEEPRITATLTNHSNQPVRLARPLDGSDMGRFPQFMWTVTAQANASPMQVLGRCGNTNPITKGVFFMLPTGESVVLNGPWVPVPSNQIDRGPGTYTIQAAYSTDGDDPRSWIGGPLGEEAYRETLDAIAPLLAEVPRVTIESNTLDLHFTSAATSD